ncbi:MAG: cache domain-containing protein, partial [Clostridia bacterium]|nr:cache domain-containing protein [Clostridia bacterium]
MNWLQKAFRRVKLQTRIFVSFLTLMIVTLGVIGFISFDKANSAIHNKIEQYSVQITDQIAQNLSIEMSRVKEVAVDTSNNSSVQEVFDQLASDASMVPFNTLREAERFVMDKFVTLKSLSFAGLLSNKKLEVSSGDKLAEGEDQRLIQLASEAKQNFIWTPMTFANSEGTYQQMGLLKVTMSKTKMKNVGTVAIALKDEYFKNIYQGIDIGKDKTGKSFDAFIVDANGMVLSSRSDSIPNYKEYSKNKELI